MYYLMHSFGNAIYKRPTEKHIRSIPSYEMIKSKQLNIED